jgi:C1A family cysteine protease
MLERLKIGPYSVALDATPLQRYRRGIYSSRTCGASINHAGIVIGNDARGNWIIQNTWGTSWG